MIKSATHGFLGALSLTFVVSACTPSDPAVEGDQLAVLVDGTGVYTRPISTDSPLAQQFFDQGLRLTWGYHFPEAIASHEEALRHDPDHPMIHWGLALASGPNPNSRGGGLPDDPQGEARRAIERAAQLMDRGNDMERAFVRALHRRFDTDTYPERDARDQAYLAATRALFEQYPDDPDAGVLLGDAYMITRRGRAYWDDEGQPLPGTAEAAAALERVMELRPDHPGANHLYIHLLESSNTARAGTARGGPSRGPDARRRPCRAHARAHIRAGRVSTTNSVDHNQRSADADAEFQAAWGDLEFPQIGYLLPFRPEPPAPRLRLHSLFGGHPG